MGLIFLTCAIKFGNSLSFQDTCHWTDPQLKPNGEYIVLANLRWRHTNQLQYINSITIYLSRPMGQTATFFFYFFAILLNVGANGQYRYPTECPVSSAESPWWFESRRLMLRGLYHVTPPGQQLFYQIIVSYKMAPGLTKTTKINL